MNVIRVFARFVKAEVKEAVKKEGSLAAEQCQRGKEIKKIAEKKIFLNKTILQQTHQPIKQNVTLTNPTPVEFKAADKLVNPTPSKTYFGNFQPKPPPFSYGERVKFRKDVARDNIEKGIESLKIIEVDEISEFSGKKATDAALSLSKRIETPSSAALINETFNSTSKSRERSKQQFLKIFQMAGQPAPAHLNSEANRDIQKRKNGFINDIRDLKKGEFEHYIYNEANGFNRFNAFELEHLFWRMRQEGDFEGAVELFNRILLTTEQKGEEYQAGLSFLKNNNNLVEYHLAQLKTCYCNPDHSLGLSDALLEQNPSNPIAHEIAARAYFIKAKAAEHLISDRGNAHYQLFFKECEKELQIDSSLEELKEYMIDNYVKSNNSFDQASLNSTFPDPRLAVKTIHNLKQIEKFEIDHHSPTDNLVEKSIDHAFLTALIAKAAGAENTANSASIRAQLESCYVLMDQNKYQGKAAAASKEFVDMIPALETQLLDIYLSPNGNQNEILSSVKSLEDLSKFLGNTKARARIEKMIDFLNRHSEPSVREEIENFIKSNKGALPDHFDHTYNLHGHRGAFIGGNYHVGGILPNLSIGSFDYDRFNQIVMMPIAEAVGEDAKTFMENTLINKGLPPDSSLMDILNENDFQDILQTMLRKQLHIEKIEDRYGDDHALYTDKVANIEQNAGLESDSDKKELADSRTSAAFYWYARTGDCRMVALIQNIITSICQSNKMNPTLLELNQKIMSGTVQEDDFASAFTHISNIRQTATVTFDGEIYLQVKNSSEQERLADKVVTIVKPIFDDQNTRIFDDESKYPTLIEEHTFACKINRMKKNERQLLETSDSFYHNAYPMKNAILLPDQMKTAEGLVDVYRLSQPIQCKTKEGTIKNVQVYIKPTQYAGSTQKRINMNTFAPSGEGQMFIAGIPCNGLEKLSETELTDFCQSYTS